MLLTAEDSRESTTLQRAKKVLDVQARKDTGAFDSGWIWSLPPEGATDTQTPDEKATR